MPLTQRMRHRIRIEENIETRDLETGERLDNWQVVALDSATDLDAVPAEVLTGPGREFRAAGAEQADITARVTCRWFPGLTQQMRIIWDERIFNIKSYETDRTGRREYRIVCGDSGVNQG